MYPFYVEIAGTGTGVQFQLGRTFSENGGRKHERSFERSETSKLPLRRIKTTLHKRPKKPIKNPLRMLKFLRINALPIRMRTSSKQNLLLE